jgi:amidase
MHGPKTEPASAPANKEAIATVPALVAAVHRRALRPHDLLRGALATVTGLEPQLRAWAYVAPEAALLEAAAAVDLDAPLSGIPIGIKDVIDVAAMPTAYGAHLAPPKLAQFDAACVGLLRRAGALPIGKTVTAEFAFRHAGPTRNPYDLTRTPGGSSSGSAAAVACRMVPVSIGTQTGGSMIRPAAFCGVVGFKPSFGSVPRDGMKICCESLDVIGWYGRSVADVAVVAEALLGEAVNLKTPERLPRVAVLTDMAAAAALEADARQVLQQGVDALTRQGASCAKAPVAAEMKRLAEAHRAIMQYELARSLEPVVRVQRAALSDVLLDCVRDGFATPHSHYREMKSLQHALRHGWSELFGDADVIIAPSVAGEAPVGLADTGSSAFNVAWSVLGWPCMHIPWGLSRHGLPLGFQLIADWQKDVDLLHWGGWIERLSPGIPPPRVCPT